MKKSLFLLILVLSVAMLPAFPRKVLLEEFTAQWCHNCYPASLDFFSWVVDNLEDVTVVVDHMSSDPWYDIDPAACDARAGYYGITGIPALRIDGIITSYPSSSIGPQVDQRLAIDSPISIDLNFESTMELTTVTATVNSAAAAVSGNYKIRFTLISEFFDGYYGGNSQDEWHYDQLDMDPDFDGLDFAIDANSTETFTVTFPWPYVLEGIVQEWPNIKAVVYVQNDTTKEVIQSNWDYITPPPFDYVLEVWDNYILTDPNTAGTGNVKIRNRGFSVDTYDVTIDMDMPTDWEFSYTTHSGSASGNSTIEVDGESEFISEISFTPGTTEGEEAHGIITFISQANPDNIQNCEFHVMSTPDIFVINTETDGLNSEYYTDVFDAAFPDNSYGVWAENDYPVPADDLQNCTELQAAIWFGDSVGSNSEIPAGLESYLNTGGNLLVTGTELSSSLYGHPLILLLGYDGLSSYPNASSVVSSTGSVLGDDIDVAIGAGAGNLGEPYTFDLLNIADVALTYNGIPTRKSAISVDGTYKALTFGFPVEAISEATDREEVLTAVLEWFGVQGGVGTNDNNIVANDTRLIGNYPNPFNPETKINFNLHEDQKIEINIYNIKGQKVKQLVKEQRSAGQHSIIWKGTDDSGKSVSSGVYFYKMEADGRYTSTEKMILLK